MLVLQRKPSESIIFRDRVTKAFIASVQVLRVAGGRVRLGSDADQSIEIMRDELMPNDPQRPSEQAA